MTNTSREEILEKHLPYEIDMLRQTYRKLGDDQVPDEVVGNALIESFCIHARSLLDFFESKPKKESDLKNDDYIATELASAFIPRIRQSDAPFKTLRTKLNKEIFHLTRKRKSTEADQFKMITDGKQLIDELEQEISRFEGCLTVDFKAIFKCNAPPVTYLKTYLFKGPVNSTSVVSNMVTVGSLGSTQPGQPDPARHR